MNTSAHWQHPIEFNLTKFVHGLIQCLVISFTAFSSLVFAQSASTSYKEGFEEGYKQGYETGFDAGYKKAAAQIKESKELKDNRSTTGAQTSTIRILQAIYGVENKLGKESCDVTSKLAREANGKPSFTLQVSNDLCGDPAPAKRKSLTVSYVCGQAASIQEKSTNAFEHRNIELSCG